MGRIYYTDGSATGNGTEKSLGGFGVVEFNDDNIIWEYQENDIKYATNNQMELMAILTALKHIDESGEVSFLKPIIYSDSAYCVNLINDWMYGWERNGWKRPKNQEVKNLDLIKQIFNLAEIAEIRKVKGHNGTLGNEIADQLATGKRKIKGLS